MSGPAWTKSFVSFYVHIKKSTEMEQEATPPPPAPPPLFPPYGLKFGGSILYTTLMEGYIQQWMDKA